MTEQTNPDTKLVYEGNAYSLENVANVDSSEYDILVEAVQKVKGVPGAIVEIGTRTGGSAKIIIDTLRNNEDDFRHLFSIDPYGNIDIECTNINITQAGIQKSLDLEVKGDPKSTKETMAIKLNVYTNVMRNVTIPALSLYAYERSCNFIFFCLEDTEFFKRYADGVPVYMNKKSIVNEYALWFMDGPHTNDAVMEEVKFFEPRSPVGAVAVFDDIWMMDHDELVEPYLFERGWELLKKGERRVKASYVKVR